MNVKADISKYCFIPDGQRWKPVLQKNGNITKTVIFAGDYEKITENGVTKELIYLPGGGIYVRQAGQADRVYYTHTDHLGSIVSITDGAGAEVFKASYDAWGKQTVTLNTIGFHRGYTGHEHLPEFGLINMNGRMYDPIVGRFLSPDPYVQAPEFSQSFNRYSYALNNPLIYTDPTGEFFWLIPNIGWSKSGGFSFGLSAVVGIPGLFSAQAGIGYSFGNNDLSAYVGASAAFNTVYVSASTQSGFSAGWSAGLSPQLGLPISTNFTSVGINYNISHHALSGNISAWSVDKTGLSFNPSFSAAIFPEHTTNLVRGKGFRSNNSVLQRFVANGQQQDALDYFGFEGTYDPNIVNPGQFDPSNGSIKFNEVAFSKNYDYLRAVYEEELFHSQDYLYAKQHTPKDYSYQQYEEWRAQNHLYKNQGLYPKSGLNWINRIKYWGVQAGVYETVITPSGAYQSDTFTPKWWYTIYKIPRLW